MGLGAVNAVDVNVALATAAMAVTVAAPRIGSSPCALSPYVTDS